jgi:OFA family oxalate/formate antiporter-like MFS transporter
MNDSPTSRFPFDLDTVFYGWWIVLACFIIGLYAGAVIFYGFTAFFDPLVKEFGWSYTEVSFAMSLRGIEMSVLAPLVGFLVDRFGSRLLALWGVITIGLGLILLSFTNSLWMFYFCFILIAFGGGGCTAVVFMRVTTNWFKKKLGLALGIVTSGFGASGLLLPMIVWLIDDFGWRLAVIILGAGMWAIGIPLAFVIRDTPEEYGLAPDGEKTLPPARGKPGEAEGATDDISFRAALRDRAFLFLALSEGLRMMAVGAVVTHIMPYLNLLKIPRPTAGLIAGGVTVLSIVGRFGLGWLSDFFDKRYIIAISLTLMSLGMFALCSVDIWWVMLLFLFLFPTGYGGAITLRGTLLREYFGRAAFGRLLGLVMGASAVGGMIGPTFAGYIFDTTGSYTVAWISLGFASCVTVILMLGIGVKKPA